jgi:serine/threonine-protein kinase
MRDEASAIVDDVRTRADRASARGSSNANNGRDRETSLISAAYDDATGRIRYYYVYAILTPLVGLLASIRLGGDPTAQHLFWLGMAGLSVSMFGCLLLAQRSRHEGLLVYGLWGTTALGGSTAVHYFGPYSGIVVLYILAIAVVGIGNRRNAVIGLVLCVASYLVIAIPVIAGMRDRGLLTTFNLTTEQRCIATALLVALMIVAFWLARLIRRTSVEALAKLELAERNVNDQKQLLAEIELDAARANRWNEGRWTGRQLGAWQIGLLLGRGGMAEVYEAVDGNGRQGAIKVLSPPSDGSRELHERFSRELEVIARLESPYIVRVYDVSSQDEVHPYFVMERLHGFNLANHLRRGRLNPDDVLAMLRPIAQGLEVARVAGVVHRDIKPHNLFCHDGSWKILDFGVAKLIGGESTLTAGAIVGTPHYMAPEQASDPTGATVTHLADVYALAAVAYRCLTGRAPFGNSAITRDPAGLLYQVVNVAPERPSLFVALPGGVDDVLAVAMAKDPSQRFRSATEFVEYFERATRGPVTIAVPNNAWR